MTPLSKSSRAITEYPAVSSPSRRDLLNTFNSQAILIDHSLIHMYCNFSTKLRWHSIANSFQGQLSPVVTDIDRRRYGQQITIYRIRSICLAQPRTGTSIQKNLWSSPHLHIVMIPNFAVEVQIVSTSTQVASTTTILSSPKTALQNVYSRVPT